MYLVATQGDGIYISSTRGSTWSLTSAPSASGVASDSTGTYLVAVVSGSGIYTSTSGGSSWTLTTAPLGAWYAVASNSAGSLLAAGQLGTGSIFISATSSIGNHDHLYNHNYRLTNHNLRYP